MTDYPVLRLNACVPPPRRISFKSIATPSNKKPSGAKRGNLVAMVEPKKVKKRTVAYQITEDENIFDSQATLFEDGDDDDDLYPQHSVHSNQI